MKLSQTGMGTIKLNNLDEMYPVQDILLQTGQLVQYGSGIYAYNNIPLLVRKNVEKIITETLNKYGCIEVLLPTLQPEKMWKDSGRYSHYVEDGTMFTINTEKGNYCLAPTAEEAIVEFAREKLKSYKNLPVTFYQIGEKYRNEIRARGYLLRGKTFPMMDAYSFNLSEEDLVNTYNNIRQAYLEIFRKIGLDLIPVAADNGAIGGKKSEEFMLLSPIGEDTILYDEQTKTALNTEILERENYEQYLKEEYGITDISRLEKRKAIELGHIFQLGTKYSETMNGTYIAQDGKSALYYMGCYGIGVSRTVATIYEESVLKDENGKVNGFVLPESVAPYKLQIIPKMDNEEKVKEANEIYNTLTDKGIGVILDDRNINSIGVKIKDCKVLGTPYMAVLGDKVENGKIELENVRTGEKEIISIEELINKFN
jgi:prolyl-tRNA synthetase